MALSFLTFALTNPVEVKLPAMPQSNADPLVSIITPSYNQADFLEETIRAVLEQDYPNLEYLVVDGASSDGSVEIIRRYEERLAWWVSERDGGQAEALNKGLARAKGEIVAWINADDVYRPGAIREAVKVLLENPQVGLVYARLDSIDREGEVFNTISYRQYDLLDLLSFSIIGQPTVFMRRDVVKRAGKLDPAYHYLLDHQLWLRMAQQGEIRYVPQVWAAARHHAGAKNVSQASRFGEEALRIVEWARTQPRLRELLERNEGRVRAGAERLNARYLLDGGEPAEALKAYGRAFLTGPLYTLGHWQRILFALFSLVGLDWLAPATRSRRLYGQAPILVTGLHRSGTTWVGRMLSLSRRLAYVSEPLNLHHRPGVLDAEVEHWYHYVNEENEGECLAAFENTLKLRYKTGKEVAALRSIKDVLRMGRDWFIFSSGRLSGRRVLLKDPFAVFSAGWFAERLGCKVVMVMRHPAAFVSSLKRLDWGFDFGDLLGQPLLMRDWLEPFREELEEAAHQAGDVIEQGSLLWRVIGHVVYEMQQRHPEFQVVLHEELSRAPVEGFEALYAGLDLPFTSRVRKGIQRATGANNPSEVSLGSIYSTQLDSAANLENWKQRLTAEEIARIRKLTEDAAGYYYGDEDWD